MSKFKEILNSINNDVLAEESKGAIAEAFDQAVNETVKSKVQLEVTEAVAQIDEEHSKKLQSLLEAIDDDHSKKLQKVVKKIDEDHTEKLKQVISRYEKMIKEEASSFRNQLVDEISNYIDLYIDKTIPVKQIAEASENTQAKNILNEMKKLLSIDEEFITSNIKEALEEGREKINTLHKELNEAVKTNVKINQELKSVKADLILEQKTKHMNDTKKAYVAKMLVDKSPEYITENFDYVVEMFERAENDEVKVISEEAKKNVVSKDITPPASELINENIGEEIVTKETSGASSYVSELKRLDYKK